MSNLISGFRKNPGAPVRYRGHVLVAAHRFEVRDGDELMIQFVRWVESPVQGIRLDLKDPTAHFVVNERQLRSVVLWVDSAPQQVNLRVGFPSGGGECLVWNVWRDTRYGTVLYGLNDAVIQVTSGAKGSTRLECSDGFGELDLADLVVDVSINDLSDVRR